VNSASCSLCCLFHVPAGSRSRSVASDDRFTPGGLGQSKTRVKPFRIWPIPKLTFLYHKDIRIHHLLSRPQAMNHPVQGLAHFLQKPVSWLYTIILSCILAQTHTQPHALPSLNLLPSDRQFRFCDTSIAKTLRLHQTYSISGIRRQCTEICSA
jgi:hypothetical protein